jgi:hypothetical protein
LALSSENLYSREMLASIVLPVVVSASSSAGAIEESRGILKSAGFRAALNRMRHIRFYYSAFTYRLSFGRSGAGKVLRGREMEIT